MAEEIGEGVIVITADTTRYEKALAGTATKAGQAATEAGNKTASAWGVAAKKIQQSTLISEMETISALGIQVGGSVSRVASVVTSLIRPVAIATSVLGPLGLAIGGAGLAAAGTALALKAFVTRSVELGEASVEAAARLDKLNLLTDDQAKFYRAMEAATKGAAVAQDRLTLAKAMAAPQVEVLTQASTGLKVVVAGIAESMVSGAASVDQWRTSFQQSIPVIGGFLEKMQEAAGPGGGNAGVIVPFNLAIKELARIGREEFVPQIEAMKKSIKDFQAEMDKPKGEVYYDNGADPMDSLRDWAAGEEAKRKTSESEAKKRAATLKQVQDGLDKFTSEQSYAAAEIERENAKKIYDSKINYANEFAAEQDRIRSEQVDADLEAAAKTGDAWLGLYDEIVAKSVEIASTIKAAFDPYAEAISNIFELTAMGAEDSKAKLEDIAKSNTKIRKQMARVDNKSDAARLDALDQFGRASKAAAESEYNTKAKQARRAWYADQAAKLTQTAMAGGLAVAQAFAQLGPIAGGIAAGGVAIAIGTQAALIARQKPPSFHTGGVAAAADERDIRVKRGEPVMVMSQRGANNGGDELVRSLSEGMPLEVTLSNVVQVDGREVSRHVNRIKGRARAGRRNPFAERG